MWFERRVKGMTTRANEFWTLWRYKFKIHLNHGSPSHPNNNSLSLSTLHSISAQLFPSHLSPLHFPSLSRPVGTTFVHTLLLLLPPPIPPLNRPAGQHSVILMTLLYKIQIKTC